jgi:outer membrane protein assembly factor BamD
MRKRLNYILILALTLFCVSGCSTKEIQTIEEKYEKAVQQVDKGNYGMAIPLFQEIISENPGTRFAAYSYLKIADTYLLSSESKFNEAEASYRIFLSFNAHSHLVPYVLSKLIEINYKRNTDSIFGAEYTYSRDSKHFKNIITEYQRFYFLYPDSLYLKDAEKYLNESIDALAEHEFLIGNWYHDHSLYTPAISRYRYLLRNYPHFRGSDFVVKRLIDAYKKNQQPDLAKELSRIYALSFTLSR